MRFTFRTPHLSVQTFDPFELNDFSILTGLNGAGKTHLLQAIKTGNVAVDGIQVPDIAYYSYESFLAPNSTTLNSQQIENQRQSSWQNLHNGHGKSKINWLNNARGIYQRWFVVQENNKPVDLFRRDFPADESIWHFREIVDELSDDLVKRLEGYVSEIRKNLLRNPTFRQLPYSVDGG